MGEASVSAFLNVAAKLDHPNLMVSNLLPIAAAAFSLECDGVSAELRRMPIRHRIESD
jgi:hypothetical protein